jgi:short-subunit dehydrogenase
MSIRLKPLREQVIVITGASSGIGLVTARRAAEAGAKVLLVARGEPALREAVDGILAAGGEADHAPADVGSIDELRAAAAKAVSRWGRIDTWVNDAGVVIYGKLAETPLPEHERLFRTNYFGTVNGSLVALEHLRAGGGAIVTVGSIASQIAVPGQGAYSASKHAVLGFTDALRRELIAEGAPVSITLIKPSGIDTPILQHAANHVDGEAALPPPVYDPELVAEAILDAAEHPRRDVTVGGGGRAQVLFAEHFPGIVDRLSGLAMPFLSNRSRRKTPGDSLFSAGTGGRERSGIQSARRTSLYTAAGRHSGTTALVLAVGAFGLLGALAGRRRTRPRRQTDAWSRFRLR